MSTSVQFSSVAQLCLTLCNPMDCSMPGFPVLHSLLELAQKLMFIKARDTIQLSHSLSPFLLLASVFPSIRVFSSMLALHIRWPKYWRFSISPSNEYLELISFRIDWFDLLTVQGTLKSSAPQFKSINSSVLSFIYGPTPTYICDYRKKPKLSLYGHLLAKQYAV